MLHTASLQRYLEQLQQRFTPSFLTFRSATDTSNYQVSDTCEYMIDFPTNFGGTVHLQVEKHLPRKLLGDHFRKSGGLPGHPIVYQRALQRLAGSSLFLHAWTKGLHALSAEEIIHIPQQNGLKINFNLLQ
jgi:hypothetical protein